MIAKPLIALFLIGSLQVEFSGHRSSSPTDKEGKTLITGNFDGTEPFWNMEITDNRIILHCVNDRLIDTLYLSAKQAHSETYAFTGKEVFGVIRDSGKGGCTLDITEADNPTHEIYLSYKEVTYMGCGKIIIRSAPNTRHEK